MKNTSPNNMYIIKLENRSASQDHMQKETISLDLFHRLAMGNGWFVMGFSLTRGQVSWLRHTDKSVELVTMGTTTHSGDSRLSVHYRYPGNWTLKISDVTLEDDGCYQCQVNTHPPISIFVRLQVQG